MMKVPSLTRSQAFDGLAAHSATCSSHYGMFCFSIAAIFLSYQLVIQARWRGRVETWTPMARLEVLISSTQVE